MVKSGVVNMLDASTGNVSIETTKRFDEETEGFSINSTPYGWFISGASSEFTKDWPEDFQKLVAYAEANDCGFINLDRDANEIDQLETFEW